MKGHGQKLTRKQEQAIAALLSCSTQAKAAEKAGISERTLRNWLAQDAFQDAFRQARRRVVDLSIGRLQRATGKAVSTLVRLLVSEHHPTRARSAIAILQQSLAGAELAELTLEMERLKAEVEQLKNDRGNPPPGSEAPPPGGELATAGAVGTDAGGEPAAGGHPPGPGAVDDSGRGFAGPLAGEPAPLSGAEDFAPLFPPER